MSEHILYLNDDNFSSSIEEGVVLVDFFAEWCGPCKMIAPIVEALAVEMTGKAKIAKVDIDSAQNTASDLGITSIPTLILFKNGAEVKRVVGVKDHKALLEMVKGAL